MILILVLLLFSDLCVSEIIIGGLFDESREQEEIFKYAIESVNSERDEPKLKPVVINVPPQNPLNALNAACQMLSDGAVAIFGPNDPMNFDVVQSVCDAKEIPHVQTRWNHNPLHSGTVVNFYPHPSALAEAFLDLIFAYQWTDFTILYEDNESLIRLKSLIELSHRKHIFLNVQQLDPTGTETYRPTLKEAWRSGAKHFVIDCKIENLKTVLNHAQQVGLVTNEHNFILTNLDAHTVDLSPFQYSEANLTAFRLFNPESTAVTKAFPYDNILDDSGLPSYYQLQSKSALLYDAVAIFESALISLEDVMELDKKIVQCNSTDSYEQGYSLVNLMRTSKYAGLSGLIKFDYQGFRSDFNLEIYELKEGGITTIGNWSSTDGLNITRMKIPELVQDITGELENTTFIVITCLTEPYAFLTESSTPLQGNDRFEGFGIDLIKELSSILKFNYTFIIREDKKNGQMEKDGHWSGMIGDVMYHKADLAIADLTINVERAGAVDFTSPFMTLGISILFQKAGKAPPNFFSFAEPFAIDTWIALALAYFVVSISLYILGRLGPSEWTNPFPCLEDPEFLINQFTLTNSFWFSTGSLMQQGTEIAPIAVCTRTVAGFWWFFVLIMVSSYTANLAAFLATENPMKLFHDVKSLVENAEKHEIHYGAKANGATLNFFKGSERELYQKVYKYMEDHPEDMVNDNNDGVTKAETSTYAFFMESTSIDYTTQRHCELTSYGGLLDSKEYGIALRKGEPYKTKLDAAVLKLQQSGVIDSLKRKWWEERRGGGQCQDEAESQDATPLNVSNVEGVFYVTILGLAASIFVVLTEKFIEIISISRKIKKPFVKVLKLETKSYLDFENVKPVHGEPSTSKSGSEAKSIATSNNLLTPVPYGFVADPSNRPSLNSGESLLNIEERQSKKSSKSH